MNTDTNLIYALRRGDTEAFESVYSQYGDILYGLLTRMIPDDHDHKEIWKNTFHGLKKNVGDIGSFQGSLFDFLYLQLRLAVKEYLGSDYQKKHLDDWVLDDPDSDEYRQYTEGVDSSFLDFLQMIYVYGIDIGEISRDKRLAMSTIKTRVRFGINTLRKKIRKGLNDN